MIIYFADRQLNVIGQASTELPNGLVICADKKTEEIETGVAIFECYIPFDKETRSLVEECTQVGNYILRSHDGKNELYTIVEAEIDTKKQEVYIYAEDDGMDLLNEVVGAYEADKAYDIDHYINKYAAGAGFTIGINEAEGLTRKLSWDGESTATARIASVATQFDGCEIYFSFDVDGLNVVKKYINIYKERGEDFGVTMRLNRDIDSIITTKSITNLATALQCTGGTIEQESVILEKASSGSPQIKYEVELSTAGRTVNTVQIDATVRAGLTSEDAELGSDYGLKASIYMGGSWHSAIIKPTDKDNKAKWEDTTRHHTDFTFTISNVQHGVTTYSDIKFKVERTDSKGGSVGVLASTNCSSFIVPNYIAGGENGEDINSRPITIEGYTYDDGDFYVDGNVLRSRKALENWHRVIWKTEESKKNGGHITKLYSYDTYSQKTLCERAITELKKLREMEVNYEVDITKFPDKVEIGDRVNIVDNAGELYVSARVLKLEQSVADQEHKATLGEYLIKGSGIHQKVAELAEQFAKNSASAKRALSIANNAKAEAAKAQAQANDAVAGVGAAQQVAEAAQTAANSANDAALLAQEKAAAAQQAVGKVEESVAGLQTTVANAQQAAAQAQQAAQTAETKASEAQQAAANAQTKANETAEALADTEEKAENAIAKAETAQGTAAQAIADAEAAATTAAAAKLDAEQAQEDIDALGENLTTLENTMSADYARKTDLTEAEAHLQSQITQNAGLISSTVSMLSTIDETANDAESQAEKAQKRAEEAQRQADQATADAEAAQRAADEAAQAAADAQAEADIAKAAADTAQSVLDNAQAALDAAIADLETVLSREDATEDEIWDAEEAVAKAQVAASEAAESAEAAAKTAAEAQATADEAARNASEALAAANTAASYAKIAQSVANEADNAVAAQAVADQAAADAAEAQRTANTAVANAQAAQSAANQAAADAAAAQAAADEADAKAAQAASDLATAQQNLANVTSRVDATEEEVAAAQQAVETAQAAADKAKQDAQAAQSTADTAKANAATAQTAATNAKNAADKAQADATAAQQAADKAQADVDALAVRVTTAETKIEQNAEQIALRATKTEVAQTLGGYYTKEQTDAAITVKSNEITQSVASKIEIGAKNIIRNSSSLVYDDYAVSDNVATGAEIACRIAGGSVPDIVSNIVAAQDGTGNPSPTNVRPIHGATSATLQIKSKNLLHIADFESIGTNAAGFSANGAFGRKCVDLGFTSSYLCGTDATITCELSPGTYVFSVEWLAAPSRWGSSRPTGYAAVTLADGTTVNMNERTPVTLTQAGTVTQIRCSNYDLKKDEFFVVRAQIEAGSVVTPYGQQGLPKEFTVNFGRMVYDGYIDWNAGTATITTTSVLLKDLTWTTNSAVTSFTSSLISDALYGSNGVCTTAICSAYTPHAAQGLTELHFALGLNNNPRIYIKDSRFATADEFVAAMGDTLFVYPLAEPITVRFTPAEIPAIGGNVNILTDLGELTVTWSNVLLSTEQTENPNGNTESCAKFTVYGTENIFTLSRATIVGKEYTFSFWARSIGIWSEIGVTSSITACGKTFNTSGTWTKYVVTFTADSEDIVLRFGSEAIHYIYHPQLEFGNKATDWTPAPEDVESDIADAQNAADEAQNTANNNATSIAAAETTIQQLANSISALVRDGNGGSLIHQDADGLWYFNIGEIEKNISDTANELADLSGIVLDANGQIDVLKSTAAALQERTEYVRSYTDENGQPCLELGEGDSVFKVRITNTEIQFAEGTAVPAKLNRKMLVIEKAMIKYALQFGDDEVVDGVWLWRRRTNGNLGLSWKEVGN